MFKSLGLLLWLIQNGKGVKPDRIESFCEKEAEKGIFIEEGFRLIEKLIC
ncbi:hypothetical protein KKG61_01455 [bacterium]|nr:hypothetical protein [bacterium]